MATDDYDWEVNSYESWKLGIQEARLNLIRRGVEKPRLHRPDEVEAWQEGRRARAAIWTAIGGAFCIVLGTMALVTGSLPDAKQGAMVTVSK